MVIILIAKHSDSFLSYIAMSYETISFFLFMPNDITYYHQAHQENLIDDYPIKSMK